MAFKNADADKSIEGKGEVRSGIAFYSPQPGENGKWKRNRVRILPPRADHPDDKFYYWAPVHGNIPGRRGQIICNERQNDGQCAICTQARSLSDAGLKEDAKKFWPTWKGLVNVVALTSDGDIVLDDGKVIVKMWSMARTLMEQLLDGIKQLPKEERDVSHHVTGRDLIVRRKGKGAQDTEYAWVLDPEDDNRLQFLPVSPLPKAVLTLISEDDDAMYALPTVFPHLTDVQVAGLLAGPAQPEDPFEDEDDDLPPGVVEGEVREVTPAPSPAPRAPKNSNVADARRRLEEKLAAAQAEDDEDTDDEDGDEDDD